MCEVGNWIMHDYYMARIREIERRFGRGITKFGINPNLIIKKKKTK